jgi:hypothetical protein
MIRFLFRTLALLAFAIAVMFAVIDATRSIGAAALVTTPFQESFELVAPLLLENMRNWLAGNAPEFVTDPVLVTVLKLPTFAVFTVFAVLFYVIGRRPHRQGFRRPAR